MPDGFLVNGRLVYRPGVFPVLDAAALAGMGPGATGVVVVLGEFEEGPDSHVPMVFESGTGLRAAYGADVAAILGNIVFSPSGDPNIPGGASRLVVIRVNRATRATCVLKDASGAPAVVLRSYSAGPRGNRLRVKVEPSTLYGGSGRKVTLDADGETEVFDNLGWGNVAATIGWPVNLEAQDTYLYGRLAVAPSQEGLAIQWGVRTPLPPNEGSRTWSPNLPAASRVRFRTVTSSGTEVVPGSALTLTVHGVGQDGASVTETLVLNGVSSEETTASLARLVSVEMLLAGEAGAAVAVEAMALGAAMAPGETTASLMVLNPAGFEVSQYSQTVPLSSLDALGTFQAGAPASGPDVRTRLRTTFGGLIPIPVSFCWCGRLRFRLMEPLQADATVTVVGLNAATGLATTEAVVIRAGETTATTQTSFLGVTTVTTSLPGATEVEVESGGVPLTRNLASLVAGLQSNRVVAEVVSGAKGFLPAVTPGAVPFSGGSSGSPASQTDWQEALDILSDPTLGVSHVVPLSGELNVAVMVNAAVNRLNNAGIHACNAYVGPGKVLGRTDLREWRRALNSRNVALVPQSITVYDAAGTRVTLPPYYTALLAAACDAGRASWSGLTWRYVSVLGVVENTTGPVSERWTSRDNLDALIQDGLFVLEGTPQGWRWSRDVTTYGVDNNPVFCSVTANLSANRSVVNVKRALERFIGSLNRATTKNEVVAAVRAELERQVRDNEVKAYDPRAVTVVDLGNGFNVDYTVAVLETTYFIRLTAHVVRIPS